jgi:signal transduction histidine kinase
VTLHAKILAALAPLLLAQVATVIIGAATMPADPVAHRWIVILMVIGIAGSLPSLAASAAWISRLLRPLDVVSAATRRIGQGDLAVRARVRGSDELARLAGEFNDMAERLQRYQRSSLGELLQAQHSHQATIDSIPDPILVVGIDGALVQANRSAGKVLSVSAEPAGASWMSRLDPAVRSGVERARSHVLAGRGAFVPHGLKEAIRIESPEGPRELMVRAEPTYDDQGAITATAVVLQDVTRLVRLDELRSNLVATVAHELRTPLTSIRMAIHLCAEGVAGPLTVKQADLLFTARDECERLQAIVDELLDASRMDAGRMVLHRVLAPAEVLVGDAIAATRTTAEAAQVRLQIEVMPGLGEVSVDRDQMNILLSNLITNAIHHSSSGGVVAVGARRTRDAIEFHVGDDGPGIAPEHQRAVFEAHFQAPGGHPGVAGLGLAIAKRVVVDHGGEIGVDSELGSGARFWFRLALPERSARERL